VDGRRVRELLHLPDGSTDVLLHTLLAGPVEHSAQERWQPMELAPAVEPLEADELRDWSAGRLPDYMVPAAFVVLDKLPLTPNGKLARAGLPGPEASALARTWDAPATPEAVVLCHLVATLLGIAHVGLNDHFFHLGGHSLLATRLVTQIRARLGRDLP